MHWEKKLTGCLTKPIMILSALGAQFNEKKKKLIWGEKAESFSACLGCVYAVKIIVYAAFSKIKYLFRLSKMLLLTAVTSPTKPMISFVVFVHDQLAMKSSAGAARLPVVCVGIHFTQVSKNIQLEWNVLYFE